MYTFYSCTTNFRITQISEGVIEGLIGGLGALWSHPTLNPQKVDHVGEGHADINDLV